jgi:hypothetical protein
MEMKSQVSNLLPGEFLEPNIRLYSFIALMAVATLALLMFPVKEFKGYVDPFYSPTVIIIPLIGLFRLTCYAFRRYYNRHLFKHPAACPVHERSDADSRAYTGETSTLFKAENLHRYFMYASLAVLPFFYYDLYLSLTYGGVFILRLGSILMVADVAVLTLYVFSCHSVRSLIGGRNDCFSCMSMPKQSKMAYDVQSRLNMHHELFAWLSLITIVAVDLFIRAVSAGIPLDRILMQIL